MKKTHLSVLRNLLAFMLFLVQFPAFSQSWDPDYIVSAQVELNVKGKKSGLIRSLGDGKMDSIPAVYDMIYKYTSNTGHYHFLGKIDSDWYRIGFNEGAEKIPCKDYIGRGLFVKENGAYKSIWSVLTQGVIVDSLVGTDEIADNMNDYYYKNRIVDFYKEVEPPYYSQREVVIGNDKELAYSYADGGIVNITYLSAGTTGTKTKIKYRLFANTIKAEVKKMLPMDYDTIAVNDFKIVFAKKNNRYEIYNGLVKFISYSDAQPYVHGNGLIDYASMGKRGLLDYYGKEILPCEFDEIWVDRLIFGRKKDSVYCYDGNRLIHKIAFSVGGKIEVKGGFDYPPFLVIGSDKGQRKKKFFYNPFSKKLLNTEMYDTIYNYSVHKNNYLLVAKKAGRYGIIDISNTIHKPFEYDFIEGIEMWQDTLQLYRVKKNGKLGFLSASLTTYLPCEYDAVANPPYISGTKASSTMLKKGNQWYLYHYKTNKVSANSYDSIWFLKDPTPNWDKQKILIRAAKAGQCFLIDSTGKKYFDFANVVVRENGAYVVLEDTCLNKIPLNITPMATINHCEELNKEHHYAIVYCLNRYFIVNKYGEMSAGFEVYPEVFDPEKMLLFTRMFKKNKSFGLYDFSSRELGKMSRYALSYPEHDIKTNEAYFIFQDSKKKKGLMNAKGELLLECKYADIGSITDGKCEVLTSIKDEPQAVDLTKLVPLKWEK